MNLELLKPDRDGWVDARDLHTALKIKTRFTDWVKRKLKSNRAQENVDYVSYLTVEKRAKHRTGANTKVHYKVSPFLAEHFSMDGDDEANHIVRNYYIGRRIKAQRLEIENDELRTENAMLKAPKAKRLTNGDTLRTYTSIERTYDMFGLVTLEKRVVKKYFSEMGDDEKDLALQQHLAKVGEGISKRLKEVACGDNVLPIRKTRAK